MIWFYERSGEHLRCEIRSQIEGDRFYLVITDPDGLEVVESFTDARDLNRRADELQQRWRAHGWQGPYSRDR